jgi:hypothetical protein
LGQLFSIDMVEEKCSDWKKARLSEKLNETGTVLKSRHHAQKNWTWGGKLHHSELL